MFLQAIEKLSAADIHALATMGVPNARVTDWKKGRRIPTRAQTLALATVAGIDFDSLERELTWIETTKDAEQNPGFASLLKTVKKFW
ncbi:MAG: hypothetical protein RL211_2263 [Pseudomonadota bacterium]|jgi:transcriptional regulator with XRE-family HTH domain